jgi:hypothetical protein
VPRPHLVLRVAERARSIPLDAPVERGIREVSNAQAASPGGIDHPLVVGRLFYSLPKRLLDILEQELGPRAFDPNVWAVERHLAADVPRQWNQAGFRDGMFMSYTYLFDPPALEVPDEFRAAWGMTAEQCEAVCTLGDDRLARFRLPARGYCGWLLTNPTFLAEHDCLLARWQGQIYHYWLPASGDPARAAPPAALLAARLPAEMVADFAGFYVRWRLSNLAGPYLPSPAAPQVPAPLPALNSPLTGATFFLPDTIPIPSREQLRDMLEDALRGGAPAEHLAEWHGQVRSDNRAKNAIDRYARLFVLQHLVAVLYARHEGSLAGNRGRLERALGRYFFGDKLAAADTVHKDLVFIRDRLGADWCTAGSPAVGGDPAGEPAT